MGDWPLAIIPHERGREETIPSIICSQRYHKSMTRGSEKTWMHTFRPPFSFFLTICPSVSCSKIATSDTNSKCCSGMHRWNDRKKNHKCKYGFIVLTSTGGCLESTAWRSAKLRWDEWTSESGAASLATLTPLLVAPGFVRLGRFLPDLPGGDLKNFQVKTIAMAKPANAPSDPAPWMSHQHRRR